MKIKDITIVGILIALSFVLGMIKISGSIALDSVPAFLALFVFKDYKAGFIGAIAHMLSAASAGFPLGLPTHLIVALIMFIMLVVAQYLLKKTNLVVTIIFILLINGIVSPLSAFVVAIPFSSAAYLSLVSLLLIATAINLVIALILTKPIKGVINND